VSLCRFLLRQFIDHSITGSIDTHCTRISGGIIQPKSKFLQKQYCFNTVVKKGQIKNIEANCIKCKCHRKTATATDVFTVHENHTLSSFQNNVDRKFGQLKQSQMHMRIMLKELQLASWSIKSIHRIVFTIHEQPTTCHPNCFILHLLSATTEDTSV